MPAVCLLLARRGEATTRIQYVQDVPHRYAQLLARRTGAERNPELAWSVTEYVCHVGDNLHSWAERIAGVLRGGNPQVGGYHPDSLAVARGDAQISLPAALWSLEISAAAWVPVLTEAVKAGLVMQHTGRGQQRAVDVAGDIAHDAHHHAWDITRSLPN